MLLEAAVGVLLGFLAGLGVGGGSLLMLWLTQIAGMAHPEARSINLLFFIPAALISGFFRRRQGAPSFRSLLPAIIPGLCAAAAGTLLADRIPLRLLKKLFGALLLLTGLRELLYRPRKAR